jgi:hypothetical protein
MAQVSSQALEKEFRATHSSEAKPGGAVAAQEHEASASVL